MIMGLNLCRRNFKNFAQNSATNGQAENAVQTIKNAINARCDENDLNVILNEFLFDYRNTKHCGTGMCPSERLFNFKPRHQLDFINPSNLIIKKNLYLIIKSLLKENE